MFRYQLFELRDICVPVLKNKVDAESIRSVVQLVSQQGGTQLSSLKWIAQMYLYQNWSQLKENGALKEILNRFPTITANYSSSQLTNLILKTTTQKEFKVII